MNVHSDGELMTKEAAAPPTLDKGAAVPPSRWRRALWGLAIGAFVLLYCLGDSDGVTAPWESADPIRELVNRQRGQNKEER
jgi:hypothetical protein